MEIFRRNFYTIQGVVSLVVGGALARDVCSVYHGTYTYCDDGYYCCDNDTRCCSSSLSAGVVAAIVLGSIFVLVLICACLTAMMNKFKYKPRRTVQPSNFVTVSTVDQGRMYSRAPPQPPAYSQTDQYGYTPPVYPGGTATHGHAPPISEKPPAYSQIYSTSNPPVYTP